MSATLATMRLNPLLLTAALGATGCAHSIDVFVPASDVPPNTEVLAAVRTGEVQTFEPGAQMETHGIVRTKGRAAPVAPSDVLVVRASAGAELGHIRVRREGTSELLTLGGVVLALAGTVASLAGAGICESNLAGSGIGNGGAAGECVALGVAGTAGSLLLGGVIIALGIGGPLYVIDDTRRVSLDASGLRVTF